MQTPSPGEEDEVSSLITGQQLSEVGMSLSAYPAHKSPLEP